VGIVEWGWGGEGGGGVEWDLFETFVGEHEATNIDDQLDEFAVYFCDQCDDPKRKWRIDADAYDREWDARHSCCYAVAFVLSC
jgi:hypothetical protein